MMRTTPLVSLAAGLVTLAGLGCAPSVRVSGYEEPNINAGSRALVITDAFGARADVGLVVDTAFTLIADDGWFYPEDGTDRLLDETPRANDTAYLQMDVLEMQADYVVEEQEHVDELGETVIFTSESTAVRIALAATIVTANGASLEIETEGVAEKDGPGANELELLDLAASEAVRRVLDEITPERTSQSVPLDDREEAQKPVVELVSDRRYDDARELEAKIVNASPTPAAHYNLAVLLDYRGSFEAALVEYAAARDGADAKLSEMIDDAEGGCQSRLAAERALE